MQIKIDEQKILSGVLERDESIHQRIKDKIEQELIEEIKDKIQAKYLRHTWQGVIDEIDRAVLDELEKMQTQIVKKILEEFYDSYKYKKENLSILKKLKEFLNKN